MKEIYRAANVLEAHIVAGMLQAEGLEAHVSGHYLQGAAGDLLPMDTARVLVADQDIAAAQAIIAEYDPAYDKSKKTGPDSDQMPGGFQA